jgi:diguanylate cyclase (GGDEF)-like protein
LLHEELGCVLNKFTKQNLAVASIGALAVLHAAACILFHPALLSSVIQLAAALLATGLCVVRAGKSGVQYLRRLWYSLGFAFFIWACGQAYDVWYVFTYQRSLSYPNPADYFWLLYSFPILLIASRPRDHAEGDWTSAFDLAQACISASLLYAIILLIPGVEIVERAYDIQGVAMLFACAISYSTSRTPDERVFFRNLTIYVISYDVLGLVTQLVPQSMVVDGGVPDLAYSFPFLIFCAASIRLPRKISPLLDEKSPRILLPAHVHGVSSLGLALTSIASGLVLTSRHTTFGICGLIVSCSVFGLRTATRESQLKRAQLQLEYDNHHDSLTGLGNRAFLIRELERPNVGTGNRSLLFLDLDRFKMINDSLGHTFGDRLLIHVANTLRSAVRPGDMVARLGGDEFVVLLNECPERQTAEMIAERILTRLRCPVQLEGRAIHASGSIGIATLREGESTIHLLRNADAAMYAAKSLGKNCVHIFDRGVLEKTARELQMETDLRRSVEESLITVSYQPVYSVATGMMEGLEALARWTHPVHGEISADEFIPLAEDAGLIVELGQQVLGKACCQVAAWNRQFHCRLTVSVNISGRQLSDRDFLRGVSDALLGSQLEPSLLKFEITESVLLNDHKLAAEALGRARALGIEIYLDDFGKGFSALNYLVEFPFDTIKIDKSFIRDVERDHRRATVMATIVQLAKSLDKKVVAEGVETLAQLKFITAIHCDYAQGFLLSKPLLPTEMTAVLTSNANGEECLCPSLLELVANLPGKWPQTVN